MSGNKDIEKGDRRGRTCKQEEKKEEQYIKIRGANEHNLKNVDVDIPRDELVVLTGLPVPENHRWHLIQSMRKGQRRYMESCPLMQDSSWDRWKSRMWKASKDFPGDFH